MTGELGELTETYPPRRGADPNRPRRRPLVWLILGALAGATVTLGAVLTITAALEPEPPPFAMAAPTMVEEASAAGVNHTYDGGFEYFVGGGVAVLDCSGDGLPDLFFAGGESAAALFLNTGRPAGPLSFERLPDPVTSLTGVTGAYPLDFDSDGEVDLAVLRVGENVLLRGLGGCRFERANESWGFDGGDAWTAAFSAMWEDGARLPTMVFGNYLESPEDRTCAEHALIRPGTSDLFPPPQSLTPGLCTLSTLFSDWSRSGWMDLRMTNDRHYYREGGDQLWRVEPGAAPVAYTADDGWDPIRIWGMGIASQDLDGDGRPEVYLTSQGDNRLQTLEGSGPSYRDVALERGVTAHRPFAGSDVMPSTGWHAQFEDINNDGIFDLFVSKGNVEAMAEFAMADPSNLLLGRPDGTFVESAEAAGIVDFNRGRGAALVDLNLDGMLDLIQVNRRTNVELWRNVGWGRADDPAPMGHWLAVRLSQPGPNTNAIGAWIELRLGSRILHREVTIGGGHASGSIGWVHFGLGERRVAEVRVIWPDGDPGPWMEVSADTFLVLERGDDTPRLWTPQING